MKAVAEIDEVYKYSNLQVVWESRNDRINSDSCSGLTVARLGVFVL